MGVALMTNPFSYGLFVAPTFPPNILWTICGAIGIIAGSMLLYSGFRVLGSAGAGFLYEYLGNKSFVRDGIYAYIRHPLFFGGVIGSFGISLLFHDLWTVSLAIVTIAMLPIYKIVEDERLIKLYGEEYFTYKSSVGAFIPRIFVLNSLLNKKK
jgi:protein-S-isoprenylcysteine O-methyltransferase Ste14